MTSFYGRFYWCFVFILILHGVFSLPVEPQAEDEIKDIFHGTKRDTSTPGNGPLLKSALFNPYLYYPPFIPPKPFLYPPLTPSDILLNRFAKSSAAGTTTSGAETAPSDPTLIGAYFKSKKDEFLQKLFDKIASEATESPDISARSVTPAADDTAVPPSTVKPDPSFFLNKKFDFLAKLFKTLNSTTTTPTPLDPTSADDGTSATTLKPTIVPPDFWFPFPKLPKPTKAPKPPKPPKAKKILKDALDAILLQSLLQDLGVNSSDLTLSKRAAIAGLSKKTKLKVKPTEEITEYHIPSKVDPEFYSSKASDYLDKLFKALNKSDPEEVTNFVQPKATIVPLNFWTPPSETEYTSKLDAFLDLLIKSLNATENSTPKPAKSKKFDFSSKKIKKRASFLDELLHRIPPSTTTTPQPDNDCNCTTNTNDCCCTGNCSKIEERSLFKAFGPGFWIPQYIYAAKMGLYLDKLIDTINTEAADDFTSSALKRSTVGDDMPPLQGKDAAVNLLITELTELKNDIIDAFVEGIKAQKIASTTSKPSFGPPGKFSKKPFWGPKPSPTPDPVAQIQKRIDLINDVFDKLTTVEKTLLFAVDPDDPKLIRNLTQILQPDEATPKTKAKSTIVPPTFWKPDATAADDPNYYVMKTQEFLKNLYTSKFDDESEK